MTKVFIDGSVGTTGLRIHERLSGRDDLELVTLPEELRKDSAARKEIINSVDVVFLCLPDDAAREAVAMTESSDVVIIDTSTAHRTENGWAYGFPELSEEFYEKVRTSKRIAVPGCHASGFAALVFPLVEAGLLPKDAILTCHSLTGYSGGGKKMIAEYNDTSRDPLLNAPRQYGITQQHKHLKEVKAICGLEKAPLFSPIVADFYSGMEMTVPLFSQQLGGASVEEVAEIYKAKYNGPVVRFSNDTAVPGFISAAELSGLDSMRIGVFGNQDRMILTAVYDNLGKGASGAAVECLNIVLGASPTKGLQL